MAVGDEPNLAGGGGSTASSGYAVNQIADSIGKGVTEAMDKIVQKVIQTLDAALGGGGGAGSMGNGTGVSPAGSAPVQAFGGANGGNRGPDRPQGRFNPMPLVAYGTAAMHRVEMGQRPERQQTELNSQQVSLMSGRGGGQTATWQTFNDISRNRSITGFNSRGDRDAGVASIVGLQGYKTNSASFNNLASGVSALSLMNPQLGYGGAAQAVEQQYSGASIQNQIRRGAPTFTALGGKARNAAVVNREAVSWASGGKMLSPEQYASVTAMNGRVRRNLTNVYGEEATQTMITQGGYEAKFRQDNGRQINWSNRADRKKAGVEDTEYRKFQKTTEAMTRAGDTTLQGESSAVKKLQTAAEGAAIALEKIGRMGNGGVGGFVGQTLGFGGALAGPAAVGAAFSGGRGGGGGGGIAGGAVSSMMGHLAAKTVMSRLGASGAQLGAQAATAGGSLAATLGASVGTLGVGTIASGVGAAALLGAGIGTGIQHSKTWRNGLGRRLEKWGSTALFRKDGKFGIGETGGPGSEGTGSGGSSIGALESLVGKAGVSHRVTATTGGKHSANSLHYKGQAIDIAGAKPGKDTDDMRKLNNFLADNYGSALKELIYGGPGAKNIKNGKPHTYSKAILDQHHDHVHVGADPGGLSAATGLKMDPNVGGGGGTGGSGNGQGGGSLMSLAKRGFTAAGGLKGWAPTQQNYASTRNSTGGGGGASGSASGNVGKWIGEALGILGLDSTKYSKAIETIIMKESGGNPRAQNNYDSNAKKGTPSKGIMQTIDSTFNAHKLPGHDDIWNPVDNIIAATRYAMQRYGSLDNVPGVRSLREGKPYKGYAKGAWEVDSDQMAYIHKGEMIVPDKDAAAIRASAKDPFGSSAGRGGGGNIIFQPGSVVLQGVTEQDARKFWNMVKTEKDKDERYAQIGGR